MHSISQNMAICAVQADAPDRGKGERRGQEKREVGKSGGERGWERGLGTEGIGEGWGGARQQDPPVQAEATGGGGVPMNSRAA